MAQLKDLIVTGPARIVGDLRLNGTINGFTLGCSVPSNAVFTDTNTWRTIQCNGTSIGNNTLNLKAGTNVTLSNSNGTITINSSYSDTSTTYDGHYTPSGSAKTGTASGSTLGFGGAVVTGLTYDGKGHITGFSTSKLPGNPNTDASCTENGHYTPATESTTNKQSAGSGKYISGIKLDSKKHVVGIDTGTLPSFTESCKGTVTSITPGTGLTGASSDSPITSSGTINLKTASNTEIGGIKIGYSESDTNYAVKLDDDLKGYVTVPIGGSSPGIVCEGNDDSANRIFGVKIDSFGAMTVNVPQSSSTNYYHSRVYSSGLKISTGTGVSDMYVPKAASNQLGVIKTGYTTSGKNYKVEVDSDGNAYVNVPWTDNNDNTWRGITDSVTTTSSSISASATAVKTAYELAASKGSGTVTSITPGTGLTNGTGETAITSTGTLNLKTASSTEIGGIKTGYSESGKNYAVKLDSNNKAYVNVPWVDSAASTSANGLMTTTMVSKLNGIASGATNVTESTVSGWGFTKNAGTILKIKVNGSEMTPNVNGVVELGEFSTTDEKVTQTVSTSNSNYPILTKSTNSTSTTTAATAFSAYVTLNPSTRLLQVGSSSSSSYYGKVQAGDGFFQTSDERLKNFGEDVKINFEALKSIPKKYFTWKDDEDNKLNIGTSAQEIQKIYPEVVSETDGVLTVDYNKLSIVALKAVDELYDKNKELEARIERLEKLLIKE